jgi:prephenate dehydrogenase
VYSPGVRFATAAVLGYGRFGRALVDLCLEHGVRARAFDPRAEIPHSIRAHSIEELADGAQVIVVAVPVAAMRSALNMLAPHAGKAELVIDVGSVKARPVEAMRDILGTRIRWAGTHPLFGPTSLALGERPLRVIVCPNAMHADAGALARTFYEQLTCEVIEQDADEHDRAMAETHALAFFVAKGLLDMGAGAQVDFAPPSFQAIARTIEAVRSDAGHLFLAIQRENPHAALARKKLLDALSNVDEQISSAQPADEEAQAFVIPGLGASSPDLRATRELIDEVDEALIGLLARRAELSRKAGAAKAEQGRQAVRDPERERSMLVDREAWAKARGLDPAGVRDVFDAILRWSRALQRAPSSSGQEKPK